jgi:hypothetical protein
MNRSTLLLASFITALSLGSAQTPSMSQTKNKIYVYKYGADTTSQKIQVIFLSRNKILFDIKTYDKGVLKCVFKDTARALSEKGADNVQAYVDEVLEDMYPAIEYICDKQRYLTIGIEARTKKRLFVSEPPCCDPPYVPGCRLRSPGTLRLQPNNENKKK